MSVSVVRGAKRHAVAVVVMSAMGIATAVPARASVDPASGSVSSLTCRGQGVDPNAKVRYKTQILIHAPLETVWRLQTDVENWPSWQAAVMSAERLDHHGKGALRAGSSFRWTTPVPATPVSPATTLTITSTVQQLKHGSCIRWTGPAVGGGLLINGTHVWNFTKVPGGVLVRTEETHTGPQVDANVDMATQLLGGGLEAWLAELKATAEARTR
ncbi:SRPBCC family protein [Catenulispora yoronensis]|uniref:SRPBCC family protein n=1 Tax=Catenulispora yoronensis TaxID=450799 RepID=A0ABP5GNK1_9ACTN